MFHMQRDTGFQLFMECEPVFIYHSSYQTQRNLSTNTEFGAVLIRGSGISPGLYHVRHAKTPDQDK